jgi:glycosyltransferase involved in cell wall biosynthesis
MRLLTQRLPLNDFDALVVVCEGLGDLVVFRNGRLPTLCFCLTPLRIAFDSEYRHRYFGHHGLLRRAVVLAGTAAFRVFDRLAWRSYDRVMCISEEVRRRVLAGGLAPADKLEVAYVGLGFEPPAPSGHFGDYFLLPGRIMWTKNIELGIRAFLRFRAMSPDFARFRLTVAGIVDRKSEPYLQKLKALAGGDSGVVFKVFPSDAELAELYDHCYGVLFTAFNEDWGIVPIEGMAFGKPVIAVNRGGPRESMQHGVQGFLEEPDEEAFARRMAQLAGDPGKARAMGREGLTRAKVFDWNRLTNRVDEQLERMVSAREDLAAPVSPARA